jgi:hypothetical protein
MFIRRTAILVAACWHLCLTALILPAHFLWHASDIHYAVAATAQIDNTDLQVSGQHHPDDCQLCKLDSQLQPAALSTPGLPVDLTTAVLVRGNPARISPQTSEHFSGRAPPFDSQTTSTIV